MTAQPDNVRSAKSRLGKTGKGILRSDVEVHPDDWPQVHALEDKLNLARGLPLRIRRKKSVSFKG